MKPLRTSLVALILTITTVACFGETIAVSVRSDEPATEWTTPLIARIEEGLMDALFDAGHIVFDLESHEGQRGRLLYIDADQALAGGAGRLLYVTVSFGRESAQGITPDAGWAVYATVPSVDELAAPAIDVAAINGYEEMTPIALAQALGERLARAALDGAEEVAW